MVILYPITQNPVAARSKTLVCGRSFGGIVGSNPSGDMDVCCECCVLSGRGLCDELITRPEKWCVVVRDQKKPQKMRRPWPAVGRSATGNKTNKPVHSGWRTGSGTRTTVRETTLSTVHGICSSVCACVC